MHIFWRVKRHKGTSMLQLTVAFHVHPSPLRILSHLPCPSASFGTLTLFVWSPLLNICNSSYDKKKILVSEATMLESWLECSNKLCYNFLQHKERPAFNNSCYGKMIILLLRQNSSDDYTSWISMPHLSYHFTIMRIKS